MHAEEIRRAESPAAATSTGTGEIPFHVLKTQYKALKVSIDARIRQVLEHGQYIMGPEVKELEEDKLAAHTGAGHCIAVAIGVRPGDEVITTPFTFVATAEAIVLLGAVPVFVDIEADTCNINVVLIEAAITPPTRAIMLVISMKCCQDSVVARVV